MWKNENIQRVTEAGPRVGFLAIKKKKKKSPVMVTILLAQ